MSPANSWIRSAALLSAAFLPFVTTAKKASAVKTIFRSVRVIICCSQESSAINAVSLYFQFLNYVFQLHLRRKGESFLLDGHQHLLCRPKQSNIATSGIHKLHKP